MADPKSKKQWIDSLTYDAARRALEAIDDVDSELESLAKSEFPSIKGYIIHDRLGGGGGGDVYRAIRKGSENPVALKLLSARLGSGTRAKRAWRELDILQQLREPCIPRLLDHGTHQGRMYLAMEYIEGLNLLEYCNQSNLTIKQRVSMLALAVDAVHCLHEVGVLHRDLKPSNILVGKNEKPVLIDLGIATLLTVNIQETLTEPGQPLGSPAFMAPEQARGERVSTRSDVYGLGATAYMLLTGNTPHDMDTNLHEAIRRVAQDHPRDIRDLDAHIPKPLAAVLTKAVSPNAKDRYASAAEFAADLRRWLNHEPVEAGGISLLQRIIRSMARHPIRATAALCITIAVASVASAWGSIWWINSRPVGIELDQDYRKWLRLRSYSGNVVHTWQAGENNRIIKSHIVEIGESLGGGKAVLFGILSRKDNDPNAQFFAYDFHDPNKLLWSTGTGPPLIKMPEPISVVEGNQFALGSVVIEDIFPDIPGKEIVTVHGHTAYSPNLIRIYDQSGRIVYQVWHDGQLGQPIWIPETGTLVLSGLNSEGSWDGRGQSTLVGSRYPLIVLGIRPEVGQVYDEWIHTPGGLGTIEPAFYKCVLPLAQLQKLEEQGGVYIAINRNVILSKPQTGLFASVLAGAGHGGLIRFFLDSNGNELDREETSDYKRLRIQYPDLPDASEFRIDDLPPLLIDPRYPEE